MVMKHKKRSLSSLLSSTSSWLRVSDEVLGSLRNGEPVVALESTLVAHGMPYPENYGVARRVESILREAGVTPATVAVLDGTCRVGLSPDQLLELAQQGSQARKCSTRELSLLLSNTTTTTTDATTTRWGATTVASTMSLAHRVGISTFVTGGIGGVHRNGHVSMDVSADLMELSRTPVVVVSAGIKSILDIGRTLEVLETLGVPTVTYQTNDFPSFFSPSGGQPSPWRVDSATEIAQAYWAARHLQLSHGLLVAVPNHHPAGETVERAIQDALQEAERRGISGHETTPFLLQTIAEQTGGESLQSNIALVENNATVGADIAKAIATQQSSSTTTTVQPTSNTTSDNNNNNNTITVADNNNNSNNNNKSCQVIVLGGAVVDMVAKPKEATELLMGTSNPGSCVESDGGVGRNVAEALGRLGCNPVLYSAVGSDLRGQGLLERLHDCGCANRAAVVKDTPTATYLAVLNGSGELHVAIANMAVLEEIAVPPTQVFEQANAQFLVMDANPTVAVLKETAQMATKAGLKVCLEPTSVPKARDLALDPEFLSHITYAFPNVDELLAMAEKLTDRPELTLEDLAAINQLPHIQVAATMVLKQMNPESAHLVITMGDKGVFLASREKEEINKVQHFPAPYGVAVQNATGAGDSLCAAFIASLLAGKSESDAVAFGMQAATLSLQCADRAVSPALNDLRI